LYDKLSKHKDFAQSERNGIIQIVRGLPDALYATEKKIFVMSNYPKDFSELKEKLLAMEAESLSVRRTESDTATAFFAGRGGPHIRCFNCGGNHFARECPANKGSASNTSGSGRSLGESHAASDGSTLRCDWCGKPGHVEDRCFKKKQGKPKETKADVVALTLVAREQEFVPAPTVKAAAAAKQLNRYREMGPRFVSLAEMYYIQGLRSEVDQDRTVTSPWWLDSGSKYHITGDLSVLHDYCAVTPGLEISIEVGNGNVLRAVGYGNVVPSKAPGITIEGVFYVPGFKHNLISVSVLTEKGYSVVFDTNEARVARNGVCIRASKCTTGLYKLLSSAYCSEEFAKPSPPPELNVPAFTATIPHSEVAGLWHRRFGHLGVLNLKRLVHEGMVKGIDLSNAQLREFEGQDCEPCILGKQTRDPFPTSESVTSCPLELVHLDVCGPLPVSSKGHRFFVTMLDDFTGISVVQPIKHKSDVFDFIERGVTLLEVQCEHKLKCLRTDNGGEFVNSRLKSFCMQRGVRHELSAPYSPQQNGKAERLNRTLLDKVRAMLAESGVSKSLWHEALSTACYLRNRSPLAGKSKTPYESFTGDVPDVSHLRVFGCVAYAHVPKGQSDKLSPRARKGIFLGYEPNTKAYRILVDGSIMVSRDVDFRESVFVANGDDVEEQSVDEEIALSGLGISHNRASEDTGSAPVPAAGAPVAITDEAGGVVPDPAAGAPTILVDEAGGVDPMPAPAAGAPTNLVGEAGGIGPHINPTAGAPADLQADEAGETVVEDDDLPPLLDDVDLGDEDEESSSEEDSTPPVRTSAREKKPNTMLRDYVLFAEGKESSEPNTLAEAQARSDWPHWKAAMDEEMKSLLENRTWDLEELPKSAKKIGLKWVFKLKRDANGNIERYKARLVAKGFTQKEGVDFGEVFAPVGKYTSLRALLAVVAAQNLELHQLDIKTAFLNGVLEEEVFTEQPAGYEQGGANVACHLRRALYGLRQAPRTWYVRLRSTLEQMGFKPSSADPGLFIKGEGENRVHILVYVDDLLIACNSCAIAEEIKSQLRSVFEMRDLGESNFYLGFEIRRDRSAKTLHISQKRFVKELLSKFGMDGANGRSIPMDANVRLSSDGESLDTSLFPYSELVGSLLYLSVCSRPDISFAVGALARHMAKPTTDHWCAAKCVLRYLVSTPDVGIKYGGNLSLVGYCDSDLAGSVGRRSTTGYVFVLGGGAISWSSKLQSTVATSTAEAEYMAAASTIKEALWLRHLLHDLGLEVTSVPIKCDNRACISMLESPISSARTKHIDVCHHFARERVERGEVRMVQCSTLDQMSDFLTKALPKQKIQLCMHGLGLS
ncbi:hypothetical protein Vretifemale_15713, partial [Volvox reticuliferus]